MAREDLTDAEKLLYDDDYTSTPDPGVYDPNCYICNDPDFARMGLPLCRPCAKCQRDSGGLAQGHVAADETVCSVCGHDDMDEYEAWLESQINEDMDSSYVPENKEENE